uniref:hypothetical protein n=1 Tax=Dialister sp. TaxID=1955814 RepID=UPI0040257785
MDVLWGAPVGAVRRVEVPARAHAAVVVQGLVQAVALVAEETVQAGVRAAVVAAVLRKLFEMYLIFWSKHYLDLVSFVGVTPGKE